MQQQELKSTPSINHQLTEIISVIQSLFFIFATITWSVSNFSSWFDDDSETVSLFDGQIWNIIDGLTPIVDLKDLCSNHGNSAGQLINLQRVLSVLVNLGMMISSILTLVFDKEYGNRDQSLFTMSMFLSFTGCFFQENQKVFGCIVAFGWMCAVGGSFFQQNEADYLIHDTDIRNIVTMVFYSLKSLVNVLNLSQKVISCCTSGQRNSLGVQINGGEDSKETALLDGPGSLMFDI